MWLQGHFILYWGSQCVKKFAKNADRNCRLAAFKGQKLKFLFKKSRKVKIFIFILTK